MKTRIVLLDALTIFCIFAVLTEPVASKHGKTEIKLPLLRGINKSGTEYACIKGDSIFDGPADKDIVKKMKEWNINVVRVPLNEGCWLGLNVPKKEYGGKNYQKEIKKWVKLLRKNKLRVILELHWSQGRYSGSDKPECVDEAARCQKPMPNMKYSPKFWKSVARMFKNDVGVLFDLFNEPFPDRVMSDKTEAWKCWRDGGNCPGIEFEVAGMNHLVNTIRETGAKNIILLGGLNYANDLDGWLDYLPDNTENIAASMHSYNFNPCITEECWEKGMGKINGKYPVIVGEIGENTCKHDYIDKLMDWLDERKIHYLAWTWNNWDCKSGPSLISNWDGEPTEFGKGFKDHLATQKIEF